MFPIGDDNRGRHRTPFVTYILIAINVAVFLIEVGQPDPQRFIEAWGTIPARITAGEGLSTLFTSMFMHGGWGHLLSNMLFLWIFGDNVEDAFGALPYLVFYLLAGLAATMTQVLLVPDSTIPQVGASGAIAGILGAYIVMFGTNRVRVIIFGLLTTVPAFLMIGLWIITQMINGFGAFAETQATGGIAYGAHVGGFFAGVILSFLMRAIVPPARGRTRV